MKYRFRPEVFYRIKEGRLEIKMFEDVNEAITFLQQTMVPSFTEEPAWQRVNGIEIDAKFKDDFVKAINIP